MINIAILGFGTVGGGVAEVIEAGYNLICKEVHEEIYIKYILDMRDFPDSPYADRVVHDFSVILNESDEMLLRRLGINVSCEAHYENKRLYHK